MKTKVLKKKAEMQITLRTLCWEYASMNRLEWDYKKTTGRGGRGSLSSAVALPR